MNDMTRKTDIETMCEIAEAVCSLLRAVAISCYTDGPTVIINGRNLSIYDIKKELPARYHPYIHRESINQTTGIAEGRIIISLNMIDLEIWYML